jgi:hypothetical protein
MCWLSFLAGMATTGLLLVAAFVGVVLWIFFHRKVKSGPRHLRT